MPDERSISPISGRSSVDPEPFPVGARVHHANQLWTFGWAETERRANPQWGWGTVIETKQFPPARTLGDWEVKVRSDAPLSEGGSAETWWPGWLIDEVHP